MSFENFTELADLVADYAHRTNLLQRIKDTFIPLASNRIGRDLESRHNEQLVDFSDPPNPIPLPDDFGKVRSLWYQRGGHTIALQARDDRAITYAPATSGDPLYYMIRNGAIEPRPFSSGAYTLSYYSIPQLGEDDPTNQVLLRFPQLYIYGALIEVHTWVQDIEQRNLVLSTYADEIKIINRAENRARMDAPAAVGRP